PPPLSTPDPPSYFTLLPLPPRSTLFPYTTLFRSRNEILQMAILEPEFAVLDETDSGLDIDALKVVARGVQEVRTDRPELGVLLITHYQRILSYLQPDKVHVLIDGRVVESGGPDLAERLEEEGY